MISKKTTVVSSEEQLLDARKKGLNEAQQVNAMQVHGKVLGMDSFSWVNPQIDMLATFLSSFPFSMVWAGSHDQIKWCLEQFPELATKMESVIVCDRALLDTDSALLEKLSNVACVEGTDHALEFVKTMKPSKGGFLFTTSGGNAQDEIELFNQFIRLYK